MREAIRRQGYEPVPGSPADFTKVIRADYEKWGKVIREAKITFD